MRPILSILIPTVEERAEEFYDLLYGLEMTRLDHEDKIEILYLKDNKEMTIGEKRNKLYAMASGIYSLQLDDDDGLCPDWHEIILNSLDGLDSLPDCITFQERVIIDGTRYTSNHSIKYTDWWEKVDGFDYVRTPFMKDVIRTSIARAVPVPHIRFGEDHQWSRLIKPLLQTEVHIDKEVYFYNHESSDHNTRYGLNK